MDLVACPQCDGIAEVCWRVRSQGASGPVELAKILCVVRHWFLLPADRLTRWPELLTT